jgi:hypothetical protein
MHTQEITISLAKALDTVLQVTTASSLRAGDINIIRDQGYTYSCVGSQVIHTHGGIISIHQALKIVKHMHRHCILLYFWQIEHLFDMHIETSQVWHIQAAVELVDANTFIVLPSKEDGPTTSNYYRAYACDMHMYIQVHEDSGFTYSAVSPHMITPYLLMHRPVAHFTFPRLGIAIPLRPSDVLFFKPKEPHCISPRSRSEDNVYCLSFCLKSTNIDLSDNDKAVSSEEEYLLVEYNSVHNK